MGYRFDCDPAVVGDESHRFLQDLAWAAQLPTASHGKDGWEYDCSGWKRPHRAIPLVMAAGLLHRDLATPDVEIRGEDDDDIQQFHVEGDQLSGPGFEVSVSWPWLANCVQSLRANPYWDPSEGTTILGVLASNQSSYAGYGPASASEVLDALRPMLLASVLGKQERIWGHSLAGVASSAAERFDMFGTTLAENEERYLAAQQTLARRGIQMPATLGELLAGYSRFPASW